MICRTRAVSSREIEHACFSVIARSEATKQASFLVAVKEAGLLRFARNDVETWMLILAT